MNLVNLAEQRWIPDIFIRVGIRQLLNKRLQDEYADRPEQQSQRYHALIEQLKSSAVAIETDAANRQHYEVPAAFYQQVLGVNLKYSACLWEPEIKTLDAAEAAMLKVYCQRAELKDGIDILELGCGWGSLTLWMASFYPNSKVTAVSNSASQREYIMQTAKDRGLSNITVITCDVNDLDLKQQYDRVVSIEMFEHVRNYAELMKRISGWLRADGKLFVHIFCHRYLMYPFETEGEDDWMGQYFFTGGMMPASDTLLHFQQELAIEQKWNISGTHYQKTAEAWLDKLNMNEATVMEIFRKSYGDQEAAVWVQRWRMFFMACAELFGHRDGSEWLVAHYRFKKRA